MGFFYALWIVAICSLFLDERKNVFAMVICRCRQFNTISMKLVVCGSNCDLVWMSTMLRWSGERPLKIRIFQRPLYGVASILTAIKREIGFYSDFFLYSKNFPLQFSANLPKLISEMWEKSLNSTGLSLKYFVNFENRQKEYSRIVASYNDNNNLSFFYSNNLLENKLCVFCFVYFSSSGHEKKKLSVN